MHLLAAKPGGIADDGEAVDLGQTPGDIVLLSAADTELACFAAAQARLGDTAPSLRLANYLNLAHNLSVDLYVDRIVARARLVILHLLGGESYWAYGVERIAETCTQANIPLVCLPGDDKPDPLLAARSTVAADARERLWRYLIDGGIENAAQALSYAGSLIGHDTAWREPKPLPRAGVYLPGMGAGTLEDLGIEPARPTALVTFYRALLQGGSTAPIDALAAALRRQGFNAVPVFVSSLKEAETAAFVETVIGRTAPDIVLNATGFAVGKPGGTATTPFDAADAPILQVVFAGGTEADWAGGTRGLSPRDIAMNVALPEVDGRVLSRAVAFKTEARFDALSQIGVVTLAPVQDRIDFTAALAANWARLRREQVSARRIALVLANYPNKDGRLGNGVGLDTPASTIRVLEALRGAGYATGEAPTDSAALMTMLAQGPTNDLAARSDRRATQHYPLEDYTAFFGALPDATRRAVTARWGAPEGDPFFDRKTNGFAISAHRFGNIVIGIQPSRGYNIDPQASYHDPDLPPPHGYLAFYGWLRGAFDAHAVIHMGKHGNMEWLPGKALALSGACFPEAALGPLPHIYPFIVNDPGEGSQAKRRSAAVIIDHLTPPLARAGSYGDLYALESLVDEYFEAANIDPRRCVPLRAKILDRSRDLGLDKDCGFAGQGDTDEALQKLDGFLCELKETQIRDGLHVFGTSPEGGLRTETLAALLRIPRGDQAGDESLTRALAKDLELDFNPLDCEMAASWQGARPACLAGDTPWRTFGDTVERLEALASALLDCARAPAPEWTRTHAVLETAHTEIAPRLDASGANETSAILHALEGGFVAPGPSGAPSRGRPDVLPTGRNFYSVDTRTVPTPTAWQLGWHSAERLMERHAQLHGDWPKRLAISAWGTSNMRTGGDDIAQALALMGVQPRWEPASGRVTGFEIMPLSLLSRPRVDVTLRISGFFRDAFPNLIDLFDAACRAVAALDEPVEENPLAAQVADEARALENAGLGAVAALRQASYRVFGSKPGAYGAGLQALIDEGGWQALDDLAAAYVAWGGWAYGTQAEGEAEHALFERRLGQIQAIVHNQDNREHDLLDSDDYYQFEGGMAAAVEVQSGRAPAIYHNDHANPESPRIRTLAEEIARTVRARVVNPKWIAGVMRHGYKGAFEMAATVDYLFAFAATTHAVEDHHFDAVFDAYVADDAVRQFIESHNPAALREISARLLEAQARDLWKPRSNRAYDMLSALKAGVAEQAAQ